MKKGDKVHWNYANGKAAGVIEEIFFEPVEKTIKGSKIKRNASKEEPAYLVKQEDGDKVLKSKSELSKGDI